MLEAFLSWDGFLGAALVISLIYLLLEQRYLFRQGIGKTVVKTGCVSGMYVLTLMVFMVLAVLLSIALI